MCRLVCCCIFALICCVSGVKRLHVSSLIYDTKALNGAESAKPRLWWLTGKSYSLFKLIEQSFVILDWVSFTPLITVYVQAPVDQIFTEASNYRHLFSIDVRKEDQRGGAWGGCWLISRRQ